MEKASAEYHPCPEKAFSDGQQTLNFREAGALYRKVRRVYATREEVGGY